MQYHELSIIEHSLYTGYKTIISNDQFQNVLKISKRILKSTIIQKIFKCKSKYKCSGAVSS